MPVSFLSLMLLIAMGVGTLLLAVAPLAQDRAARNLILGASFLLLIPTPFILVLAYAYDAALILDLEVASMLVGVGALVAVFKWSGENSFIDWVARGAMFCVAATLIWAGGSAFYGDMFLPVQVVKGNVEQVRFTVTTFRSGSESDGYVVVDGQKFPVTGDITKQLHLNDAVTLYFGQGSGRILRVGVVRHE